MNNSLVLTPAMYSKSRVNKLYYSSFEFYTKPFEKRTHKIIINYMNPNLKGELEKLANQMWISNYCSKLVSFK